MTYYVRKSTRIPNYDYSSNNYYFITICTHNRKCLFGGPHKLNCLGETAKQFMEDIPKYYPQVKVDNYVIMPNHVHSILIIDDLEETKSITLSKVVGQYKMAVSRAFHITNPDEILWQRSFHDHVIRNRRSYENIWLYIEGNPSKWEEDCFYWADPVL